MAGPEILVELAAVIRQRIEAQPEGSYVARLKHAGRTLCRSAKHYHARRGTKAPAHNASRHLNAEHGWPQESTAYLRRAM